MENRFIPTREALQDFAKKFPEINATSVETLILFQHTADYVQHKIFDILEQQYNVSEGKLVVMIALYQSRRPLAPSELAEKAGVTRATISVMLRRMQRDGLVCLSGSQEDKRAKTVELTESGRAFIEELLPSHFLRIASLVSSFSEQEKLLLIGLLKKLLSSQ